jgi:Domain of unknown function (DUF4296)
MLSFSCENDTKHPKPSHYIPREKMKAVLKDILVAEAYSNSSLINRYQDHNKLVQYKRLEKYILKKYTIDTGVFRSNLEYYLFKDPHLSSLFADISTELTLEKKKLDQDSIQFRKKDSLAHPERKIRADKIKDSLKRVAKINILTQKRVDSLHKIQITKEMKFRLRKNRPKNSKKRIHKKFPPKTLISGKQNLR